MLRKLIICGALFWLSVPASSFGAPSEEGDIPALPPIAERERPFYISSRNATDFSRVLLAPLADLLTNGKLIMRAASRIDELWAYSAAWEQNTAKNSQRFQLAKDGALIWPSDSGESPGFPFGDAATINSETDLSLRALKILWNCAFAESIAGETLIGFEEHWHGTKGVSRSATGIFARETLFGRSIDLVPDPTPPPSATPGQIVHTLSSLPRSEPIFRRELFQLLSPPVVFGYSVLTYRYAGQNEDDVWIYSPIIGRSRKVLDSNRADPLLGSALTNDDLLVFGTHIPSVEALVVEEKTLLIPMPEIPSLKLQSEQVFGLSSSGMAETHDSAETSELIPTVRGAHRKLDGQPAFVLWNQHTSTFAGAPGWVPTSIVFVPRKVWILELSPKDPFSVYGRQVLVVDEEMMLPVYKVVYSRKGIYDKLILGAWNHISSDDQKQKFASANMVLAVTRGAERANTFSPQYIRLLSGANTKIRSRVHELYDIRQHAKHSVAADATASGAPPSPEADAEIAEASPSAQPKPSEAPVGADE